MKKIILIILFLIINSCKRENSIQNISSSTLTTNTFLEKAKIFKQKNLSDSAFIYFNLAKNTFLEENDSLGAGRSLANMGIIQTENGDFLGGIESSMEAAKYIHKRQDSNVLRTLAANYNNLGIASNRLKDYDKAVDFYEQAINNAVDQENKYIYYNNIGDILTTQGEYEKAIKYLDKAILADSAVNYARALNNLAKAKYLFNKSYNPIPEFYKALEIRKKINDGEGQNSSYETLSTYYLDKDKNLSLHFAKMMLEAATNNKSPDDQILALQRIISLEPPNYLENFNKLNKISDQIQTKRNSDKNQFAIVRYDLEGERAKVQTLKAESAVQDSKILLLIVALILSIVLIIWFRKRQIRLKQEKELEVKNTQLKMSKKVHDVVANGLYHMMVDVQNNPEVDKTKILNNIEKMYEESRDISHETIIEEDFSSRFVKMISSYSSPEQKVLTVGYNENIWENVSYNVQLELYYIVREVLVNMKKHSNAKLASLKFEKNNDLLKIKYTDNGVGIENLNDRKGAGIHNTENRIESIGGDITFEKNPSGGLIIQITIPIH